MPDLDVAEELLPIKEKLDAIIARLSKMRSSGSVRQCTLEPIQNDLREVDELYVDEKFIVDGRIPEGQAILADLLNDAHELYGEVADLAEDDEDDDGKGDDSDTKTGK